MEQRIRHAWQVSPAEARIIQDQLRQELVFAPLSEIPQTVAGADISHDRFSNVGFAGFVVLSWPALEPVEQVAVRREITFPYIPGLLSFREIPLLLEAYDKLSTKPDLVFVDGHGIAHPRRAGIAAHLGVLLNKPTIGCAKRLLFGTVVEPPAERGAYSHVYDYSHNAEVIGAALRTKATAQPIIVSPGQLMTIGVAIELVMKATRQYRLPEPTRLAHLLVNQARRGEISLT